MTALLLVLPGLLACIRECAQCTGIEPVLAHSALSWLSELKRTPSLSFPNSGLKGQICYALLKPLKKKCVWTKAFRLFLVPRGFICILGMKLLTMLHAQPHI